MRAFVADQDPGVRDQVADRLGPMGWEVLRLPDADALLEAALAGPAALALVALDLPGDLPGIETAKLLAFSAIGRPRMAIYGFSGDPDGERTCRAAGLAGCLARPVDGEALQAAARAAAAPYGFAPALPQGVVALAAHPRFRREPPALDFALLADLETLGGGRFLGELVEEFLREAEAIRAELSHLVERGDAAGFRARVQALRSSAANVGAQGVFALCLGWRQTGRRQLAGLGPGRLESLDREIARARRAFGSFRAGLDGRKGSGA